jgi:capsular polysaccharide biosynthesis protein
VIGIDFESSFRLAYDGVYVHRIREQDGDTIVVPKCLPEDALSWMMPFWSCCDSVLLDIKNAGFSFRNQVLIDPDLNILFTSVVPAEQVLAFRRFLPRRVRHLKGTVAYLSNTWVDNYYHWMQLTLPLIRSYREMARGVHIDFYYVGESFQRRMQAETLERLGIAQHQVVREPCRADRMLTVIYTHPPQHCGLLFRDARGHGFVRSAFRPEIDHNLPRRLYIRRRGVSKRYLINEHELLPLLREYKFETAEMDGLPIRRQADLFGNADIIIGVHGAALTNLLFAKPGAKVIEIIPAGLCESSFFAAASHSRLDYHYVIGSIPDRNQAFSLSAEKLKAILSLAKIC